MKVLVTGATGFVAGHLIPALAREHIVVALGHDAARIPSGDGIEPLVVDLRWASDATLPPVDAIVHLAQANVPFPDGALDLHAVNTGATVALLAHAMRAGASHFVLASSASVYGMGDRPWREDDEPSATDFYSATKLAAERFVRAYNGVLSTTIMRLVAPYGPGQRNRMIPRLIGSVRDGHAVTLNDGGRPRMNPVYVDDVVSAVRRALTSTTSQLLNLAGPDVVSIRDIAELAARAAGVEPTFKEGDAKVAGDIVCDTARLREFDPESPVMFGDGIARVVAAV